MVWAIPMVAMFLKENPAEIVGEPIVGPSSGSNASNCV